MTYELALLDKGLDVPSVQAYMYSGKWVANCVDITCKAVNLAEEPGPSQRFKVDCPDCGARAHIVWPDPDVFEEINRLMMLRPFPGSRNWAPAWHRQAILSEGGRWAAGQSVDELAKENLDHGLGI